MWYEMNYKYKISYRLQTYINNLGSGLKSEGYTYECTLNINEILLNVYLNDQFFVVTYSFEASTRKVRVYITEPNVNSVFSVPMNILIYFVVATI